MKLNGKRYYNPFPWQQSFVYNLHNSIPLQFTNVYNLSLHVRTRLNEMQLCYTAEQST